ncbi:MAG: arpA protein [Acidimicrobiales bacterium]|jgi:hypothetical protein
MTTELSRSDVLCASLVDLDRYPLLDQAGASMAALLVEAQYELAKTGWCELPTFIRRDRLAVLLEDAESLAPHAWHSGGTGTAYLARPDSDLPEGDPRGWTGPYGTGAVAYDQFPASSPIRLLYEWEPLRAFIEAVLGKGTLYPYADTCGALNLAVMSDGDQLQWHFDQTDFVVSIALCDAAVGGDFEVVPLIRSDEDEHYDEVAKVLAGGSDRVVRLGMVPGTMLIFEGRRSIHRVSPVSGGVDRLVALLAYDTKPGTVSSPLLRKVRYGRDD